MGLFPGLLETTSADELRPVPWPYRAEELERQIRAALDHAPGARMKERGERRMIRIRLEVGNEGDAVGLAVQAESIGQALQIARAVFPSSELRVSFPLDPDSFFVRDGSGAGLIEPAVFEREAG